MKRSFYPSDEIDAKLREEAARTHRSVRKTLSDIVEAYYVEKESACTAASAETELIHPLPQRNIYASKGLTDMLLVNGLQYEDNRSKGGTVWVYDSPEAGRILREVELRFGVRFIHSDRGGKATNGKSAWYMK